MGVPEPSIVCINCDGSARESLGGSEIIIRGNEGCILGAGTMAEPTRYSHA